MLEAGCAVLGGHSVNDDEIKFGYTVTGTIHPNRVLTNAGVRAGDALIFTKRVGTGVIATALKRGIADPAHVNAAIESMLTLNRSACEAMLAFDVHGCTDVTGFGLIGHARELALASKVTIEIQAGCVQFLPGAIEYARQGAIPGGLKNNRELRLVRWRAPRILTPFCTIHRPRAACLSVFLKTMLPPSRAPIPAHTVSDASSSAARSLFGSYERSSHHHRSRSRLR